MKVIQVEQEKFWLKSWPQGVRESVAYPMISIHRHFEEKARENANLTYLSILGINFTYQYINEQASKFAAGLQNLGFIRGDHIGIFMPNLPQFVIAFFGILKIGATAVLISPLLGIEDLRELIKDSDIKAIIILDILYENLGKVRKSAPKLQIIIKTSLGDILSPLKRFLARVFKKLPSSPQIPDAISMMDIIKQNLPLNESENIDPHTDIAVIGYTGGTTGVPKGVMLTHENLISNIWAAREWSIKVHPLGEHKSFVGAVPFFHIIGLSAVMLVSFHFDSSIYLFPDPRKFESILQAIQKYKINYFHGTPTLFQAILKHPKFKDYDIRSLELVLSGAAPLPTKTAEEFEKNIDGIIIEAYGLTETSPIVTANPFEKNNRKWGSIGIPFINTEIKLLNMETYEEVLYGEIGEIAVKGPQVMKGYYNHPEETAKVMWNEYFLTGDIGKFDEDGFIHLVDRKKDMINASGFKIFPSEIEKMVLENFPEIEEVVVIGTPDEYRGESVKMISVVKKNLKITKEQILNYLKGKIAKYKIPKDVEFRSELPKTPLGKIDRKLLRKEELSK